MFESLNHITRVTTSNTLHQVLNGVVTVANIGDSRIIAVESKDNTHVKGVDISHDHKPDLPSEKERIERRGGRVFAIQYDDGGPSPARVWLKDKMLPGLAMSRSLGDTVAKQAGVISNPEITRRVLSHDRDRYLVLGSDGLWEFIESQEVAEIVQKIGNPQKIVKTLMALSRKRWLENEPVSDDTTIIVVKL